MSEPLGPGRRAVSGFTALGCVLCAYDVLPLLWPVEPVWCLFLAFLISLVFRSCLREAVTGEKSGHG